MLLLIIITKLIIVSNAAVPRYKCGHDDDYTQEIIKSQRNDIHPYYYDPQDGHCDEAQAWRGPIWRCVRGYLEEIQCHHRRKNTQGEFDDDYSESEPWKIIFERKIAFHINANEGKELQNTNSQQSLGQSVSVQVMYGAARVPNKAYHSISFAVPGKFCTPC